MNETYNYAEFRKTARQKREGLTEMLNIGHDVLIGAQKWPKDCPFSWCYKNQNIANIITQV